MQVLCSFLTRPHPDCGEGTIRLSRQLTAPLSSLVFCRCRSSYLLSRSYPLRLLGAASFKTTECSFLNLQQGSNPLLRHFCVKSCPYNLLKNWDVASTSPSTNTRHNLLSKHFQPPADHTYPSALLLVNHFNIENFPWLVYSKQKDIETTACMTCMIFLSLFVVQQDLEKAIDKFARMYPRMSRSAKMSQSIKMSRSGRPLPYNSIT